MLTISSLVLAVKGKIWEATLLGSIAASLQINKIGNSPVKIEEIKQVF